MGRYLDLFRGAAAIADARPNVTNGTNGIGSAAEGERHSATPPQANGTNGTNGTGAEGRDASAVADDAWSERVAVAEHDGGLARPDAEALADACHPPAPSDAPPDDWRTWQAAEVAARVPRMSRADAERRVYGLALGIWHMHLGARPDGHRCAGCGGPLGAHAWTLPDGARVHGDHRMPGCLVDYGGRWRPVAAAALTRLGIPAPEGEQ